MKALTIKGTVYPVHGGYGTIILLGDRTGLDFYEILDKFSNPDAKGANDFFKFLGEFTFCLIERGYEEKGEVMPDLKKLDVIDWLAEGNTEEVIKMFIECAPKVSESKNAVAPTTGQK